MELTIDEITALVFQHSRTALQLRKSADELDKLAQVYLEAGKRINREAEAKESKMNIRRIISGVMVLVLLVGLLSFGSLTVAQDLPAATEGVPVMATLNGTPVDATLEPVTPEPVKDGNVSLIQVLFDKLMELGLIAAVVVLAFKTAGLVPQDVVDKTLARAFDLAKGLADGTPTDVDNRLLEIAQPILTKMIDDALAKRDLVNDTVIVGGSQTLSSTDLLPGNRNQL